ncbi:hypothetical protein FOL47_009785 [Perkinsus chesapeaki]|uniref:BZIP domain-containing protein n=1 Tax=Perkinsus chesapeaki TaxID=330153 RepID=A0A7J6L6G9_PERCH|nr:hypothetical protein FOL47_009785 [Perkinsus chesapeaki]
MYSSQQAVDAARLAALVTCLSGALVGQDTMPIPPEKRSRGSMEGEDEVKTAKKLKKQRQNREAAQRSRDRKRAAMEQMETELALTKASLAEANDTIAHLKQHNGFLRQQLNWLKSLFSGDIQLDTSLCDTGDLPVQATADVDTGGTSTTCSSSEDDDMVRIPSLGGGKLNLADLCRRSDSSADSGGVTLFSFVICCLGVGSWLNQFWAAHPAIDHEGRLSEAEAAAVCDLHAVGVMMILFGVLLTLFRWASGGSILKDE